MLPAEESVAVLNHHFQEFNILWFLSANKSSYLEKIYSELSSKFINFVTETSDGI